MSDIVKVIRSGRSQMIFLPEKYCVDADELEISRHRDTLILSPHHRPDWSRLLAALEEFGADRFAECFPAGRDQPAKQQRPALDAMR